MSSAVAGNKRRLSRIGFVVVAQVEPGRSHLPQQSCGWVLLASLYRPVFWRDFSHAAVGEYVLPRRLKELL